MTEKPLLNQLTYSYEASGSTSQHQVSETDLTVDTGTLEIIYKGFETRTATNSIPVEIFKGELPGLQALCTYLRIQGYSQAEIARRLNRDARTIWKTLSEAGSARLPSLPGESRLMLPLGLFSDRKLSVLEHVVSLLRHKGYRNSDIARMLGLDPRTTSTIWRRAREKGGDLA